MYIQDFKNTFFVDVLEYFGMVTIEEPLPQQKIEKNTTDQSDTNSQPDNLDLEKQTDDFAHKSIHSMLATNSEKDDIEKSLVTSDIKSKDSSENEMPEQEEFDPFLVKWDHEDDKDLPLNWSTRMKALVIFEIQLLTCVTYMGSSIYTPGQEQIQHEFHVGHVTATLNMSLYVLGYGLGPIFLSPLSEVAKIGRQQIYTITFFIFTILQIGCATVHNIGGLIVLRFLTGIVCSPSLATGGASIADLVKPEILPPFIGLWSIGAILAPVLAPLLGAAMVVAKNWRWIFWLLLWMSAASLILFIFLFPETSHNNILARRAKRLRKQTGDDRYYTLQEKLDSQVDTNEFIANTLYRPIKMIVKEPIILAFDLYIALCYGCFYLFFEAFPIVFMGIYNFTLVELGLSYMGFSVGAVFAFSLLMIFLTKSIAPKFQNGTFTPEAFLVLVMCVSWCLPLALFLFGWAAGTHWIVPIISEVFFVIAVFNLFQATFAYLSMCYPKYVASVFAGNGFMRSVFACAFPLFGTAMYNNLAIDGYPVAWGSSLVGFFTVALAITPFVLYKYGPALRARSSFTD